MSPKLKGILYLAAGIVVAVIGDSLLAPRYPWVEEYMVALSGMTTIAIDLFDRWRADEPPGWSRLASPTCGGNLKLIPVWCWAAFIAVAGFVGVFARSE